MKIIYGSPHCFSCKETVKEFEEKGIKYKYVDVTTLSREEKQKLLEESGQMSLPIIIER